MCIPRLASGPPEATLISLSTTTLFVFFTGLARTRFVAAYFGIFFDGRLEGHVTIHIFPVFAYPFELATFTVGLGDSIDDIVGGEFDNTGIVLFATVLSLVDGQALPVGSFGPLLDGLVVMILLCFKGQSFTQVVDLLEYIGGIARAHEGLGCGCWLVTGNIGSTALDMFLAGAAGA